MRRSPTLPPSKDGRKSPAGVRRLALAGLLAASTTASARGDAPAPRRPDVVIVLLDAVRADHLPVHGYPRDTAPFLTSLASRAAVFDRAYSSSGWTSPATASLFASLHPFQHGVIWNIRRMRENEFRFSRLPV
jgi:predicted AlkP superfamily pyrophosphatase or phosphodiesterase